VICPFGKEGSAVREQSDALLKFFIEPVAKEAGYKAVFRTIDDAAPGAINQQFIEELYGADLVVADISGSNPNVFYELALRHSVGKPVIHISDDPSKVPFDIAGQQVIKRHLKPDSNGDQFKKELAKQISKINDGEGHFEGPALTEHPYFKLHPNIAQGENVAKYFKWQLNYTNDLPSKWLKRQEENLQKCIEDFMHDPTQEEKIPKDIRYRENLAEYLQYRTAAGQVVIGDLSYVLNKTTATSSGWANFAIPGTSNTPMSMPVNGIHREDGGGSNRLKAISVYK
jgi:hypothetical protein